MSFCTEWVKRFVHVRLYCIFRNLKSISKMSTLPPPGKISADANGKEVWGHSGESLSITAVRNTAERSFCKLRPIKTFYRSTTTNERLTNLAMMSAESETAKILDMTELTKKFAFFKTRKKSFS